MGSIGRFWTMYPGPADAAGIRSPSNPPDQPNVTGSFLLRSSHTDYYYCFPGRPHAVPQSTSKRLTVISMKRRQRVHQRLPGSFGPLFCVSRVSIQRTDRESTPPVCCVTFLSVAGVTLRHRRFERETGTHHRRRANNMTIARGAVCVSGKERLLTQ